MEDLTSILDRVSKFAKEYPRNSDVFIGYGTAGFRTKESLLDHIMFRMGIVAALRSKVMKATVGTMITASHNPVGDNGLKLVDPMGEMLAATWEKHASVIANVSDEGLRNAVQELIEKENVALSNMSSVFLGRDTRESGLPFKEAVEKGFKCVDPDGHFIDYGVITTPALHFAVVCTNNPKEFEDTTTKYYYSRLCEAFLKIMSMGKVSGSYIPSLVFDGANGVGALAVREILKNISKEVLEVRIYNDGSSGGILNYQCGADFVKVEKRGPPNLPIEKCTRYVSFDGDADRVIYFYYDENKRFRMLDGDKIAVLFALHLGDLLKQSGIPDLKLGLVQTAYANGSSTKYIENDLGIRVCFAMTGVKHLHHEATTQFDIGIYFEANGHGTVVFSEKAKLSIRDAAKDGENFAAVELACFMHLINPYVGDALSDMLAVEAILHSRSWSMEDWNSVYTDFPNRLLKVSVKDRSVVKVFDAGRLVQVYNPPGVQPILDALMAKYKNGRSFFRSSGTEDVVRVYAEADTQENADLLGAEVCQLVYDYCDGIGPRPELPK